MNGEPIIFFNDGTLGNGQHRLNAVIKSDMSINMLVVSGVDPDSFSTIDGGKKRGADDVLSIAGEKHYASLATGARSYLMYLYKTKSGKNEITSSQIKECVNKHPDLRHWASRYASCKGANLFPSAIIGILAFASEKHGIDKIDCFYDNLITGANLSEGDPALSLRNKFTDFKIRGLTPSFEKKISYIIKALNAHIAGRKAYRITMGDSEKRPDIV